MVKYKKSVARLKGVLDVIMIDFDNQPVVTLIGSGGKTTLMYYLADQALSGGKKVLITTTTKIYSLPQDRECLVLATDFIDWLDKLQIRQRSGNYLVTGLSIQGQKIRGIPGDWIDRLAQRGIFDLILVEGDGSKQKPLKAPNESEPLIPTSTTLLLPLIGLSGIGKPLTTDTVHRVEQFSWLTGLSYGQEIGIADVFQVYQQPGGYDLPNKLTKYQIVPILNQADDQLAEEKAVKLAELFLSSGIEKVFITAKSSGKLVWRVYR